jgi:anti-anti-sigma regulatory factor/HAMP domain-containing protein
MRRNLRTRLLVFVLLGIVIVAGIQLLTSSWGLVRVRDRAIRDSSQALEAQTQASLLELAQSNANSTAQSIETAQQVALTLSQSLVNPPPISEQKAVAAFFVASDQRRYQQGPTTVILPRSPEISALNEVNLSLSLELVLPTVSRLAPEILRVSYLSQDGMLRTYPPVVPANVATDWSVETDIGLQLGGPAANPAAELVWTNVHQIFGGSDSVITAVQPVYRDGAFIGVVEVDVSAEQLATALERIKVGQSGFPLVLDGAGSLITTTEIGQRALFGRVIVSEEERSGLSLIAQNPQLAALLSTGEPAVGEVRMSDQDFFVSTAPIPGPHWNLLLAFPKAEITAVTTSTTDRIRDIVGQTQTLSLLITVVVAGLIGLTLSSILRRQLVRPLATLTAATKSITSGDHRPINMPYNDEIGQLAQDFNAMTGALEESRAEILANNQRLEQMVHDRTADLEAAMERTSEALAVQQELVSTLNRVSSPIIPVLDGVLVLPLIGQLTLERTRFATNLLLDRIEHDRVRLVLLDLTGVPVLDESAADALRYAVQASRLLGARVIMVGISPDVAQTLVALGSDLSEVGTAADLRSAIKQLLK